MSNASTRKYQICTLSRSSIYILEKMVMIMLNRANKFNCGWSVYAFVTTTNSTSMIQYTRWNQCCGDRWVSIWKPNWRKKRLLTIFSMYRSHFDYCYVHAVCTYNVCTVRWLLHLYLHLPLDCCAMLCSVLLKSIRLQWKQVINMHKSDCPRIHKEETSTAPTNNSIRIGWMSESTYASTRMT